MINLQLLDMLYMDMVLSNETTQYLAVLHNTSLNPKNKIVAELLQYARRALSVATAVARVVGTVNGQHAQKLLNQKHSAILDQISSLMDKRRHLRNPQELLETGLAGLIKMEEMDCFHTVFSLIKVHRTRIMTFYGKARKIREPETNILNFGKLLCLVGASALSICEMVLDFAGCSWLQVRADRLFRFEYLTDVEFQGACYIPVSEAERMSILGNLRRRDEFNWDDQVKIEKGHIYTLRSPWDITHTLGYVILSQDILKSRGELEEQVEAEPMLFLDYVEVVKDIQGCGLGTRIVRWAMAMAESKGWREMALGGDEEDETWEFWHSLHFKNRFMVPGVSAILHA